MILDRRQLGQWSLSLDLHNSLSSLLQETFGRDPFSGAVFVFRSKRAERIKFLVFDRTGLVLEHKRLEGGEFVRPGICDGVMRLSPAQLAALFEGLGGPLFGLSACVSQGLLDERDELARASISTWRKRHEYDCLRVRMPLLLQEKTPP